jgi:hypothetical protein
MSPDSGTRDEGDGVADQFMEVRAVEIASEIVAARVGAAAGRPTELEGRDTARYFDEILVAVRRGLGLPPRPTE